MKFLFHWIWKKNISRQKLFNLIIICYYFDRLYATLHQAFFKSKILWIYFWYSHSGQSWSNSCCRCYSMVPWTIFQLLWQNFTAKKPSRFCLKRWEFFFCISEQLSVQNKKDKIWISNIKKFSFTLCFCCSFFVFFFFFFWEWREYENGLAELQILSEVPTFSDFFYLVEFPYVSWRLFFFRKSIEIFFWRVWAHAGWTSDFIWSWTNICC